MELNRIFKQPVSRPIEGVIKADDESSLYVELNEYVLTDEVAKRLEHFLDAYNDYHGANGVWVSGFFGSGKSHLLKMLALIMENRSVDGSTALDIFLPKIPKEDELLRAALPAQGLPDHDHVLIGRAGGIERDFHLMADELAQVLERARGGRGDPSGGRRPRKGPRK